MKKFVALLLTLVLTFSLAACGAEGGAKDDEAAGPGSFKIAISIQARRMQQLPLC